VTVVTQDSRHRMPNKPTMVSPDPVQVRFATARDVLYIVEAWGELARFHEQFNPGFDPVPGYGVLCGSSFGSAHSVPRSELL